MGKYKLINCPICKSNKAINMLDINCGNLDDSTLYQSVKIDVCTECGHIYNRLSLNEIDGLIKYYSNEYAPLNLGSADKSGDRPGSDNLFTVKRYAQLYSLISPYIQKDSRILDVGCAMGGFLDYLHEQGLNKLYGIDISEKYVSYAKKKSAYDIRLGSVEVIPFNNNSMDVLVMDQVLEHLFEPRKAFKEARRVLVDGGLFYISVPDASRYGKRYFFDFFWFLLREHIQHFDIEHLKLLAALEGFELVDYRESETPMMSEKMILPALSVIFRLTGVKSRLNITKDCFKLKKEIKHYIVDNFKKLNKKRKIIDGLVTSQKPVYAWGIGREFLYLYESAGLKNCNIVGLIDINHYKQKVFTVSGRRIHDKLILKKAKSNSFLIMSAIAHIKRIKDSLSEVGYRGQIVNF